jgi:hypothetical protein
VMDDVAALGQADAAVRHTARSRDRKRAVGFACNKVTGGVDFSYYFFRGIFLLNFPCKFLR